MWFAQIVFELVKDHCDLVRVTCKIEYLDNRKSNN